MLADLLQISLRDQSVYDALSVDGITPRPQWAPFVQALQQFPAEELARRWARAERRIQENGVTYNMYEDPDGASRPWRIDLIPLLLPADEWRSIEAGIIQRAELLERILVDLYGSQSLLRSSGLPPEVVFANPAFLRPLVGVQQAKHPYLHLIGVDLAR